MTWRLMTSQLAMLVAFVAIVAGVEGQQRGWFSPRRTVTKVLELRSLVVTSTPSSCVAVQTSLPPCRHIRQLDLAPTKPTRIYATRAPEMQFQSQGHPMKLEGSNGGGMHPAEHHPHPHPAADQQSQQNHHNQLTQQNQGFGWLFGLQDATVTNTVVRPFTKTVTDPNTIVTFSVKGCQPSRLPFDLGPCEDVLDQIKDETTLAKGTGTPIPAPVARGDRFN